MYRNIISLSLLAVSFYVAGAAQEMRPVPSLKELAAQRVVQTMITQEEAQRFVREPQKVKTYVESYEVNKGDIKNIIVDQLLKPYKNEICCSKKFYGLHEVNSVAWHPEGNVLAIVVNGILHIWDRNAGLDLSEEYVNRDSSVAWHPKGNALAITLWDGVRIWDVSTGNKFKLQGRYRDDAKSVVWCPKGNALASGNIDGTVCIRDVHTGHELNRLGEVGHSPICSVAWHPDGNMLASGSANGMVHIWNVHTGQMLNRLGEVSHGLVYSVAWHPDGNMLASGNNDGMVHIWDAHAGQELKRLEGDKKAVRVIAWHPEGNLLASGSRTIDIWDRRTWQQLNRLQGRRGATVESIAWHPKGEYLLASGFDDGTACIWDVQTYDRLIDSLSLMQALYFTHSMKHADVMQAEMKCIEDVERQKRKQDYYSRGIFFDLDQIGYEGYINVRDICFDFENVQEILPTLKRKRAGHLASSSKRNRVESSASSSSSSSSQKEELSHSQVYMHDLEASLPDILKSMLHKNNHKQ